MKVQEGTFNQEKAQVGAFSAIVKSSGTFVLRSSGECTDLSAPPPWSLVTTGGSVPEQGRPQLITIHIHKQPACNIISEYNIALRIQRRVKKSSEAAD